MTKLTLFDKIIACEKNGEHMPLKGHAKVILTDVRDGTKKIVESDNIITNAVASIFSKSWSGLSRFEQLLPLKNLYGGVMCFQNPLVENANSFNPPSEEVSPMIAHCGNIANNTASTLRGSRVPADEEVTNTSIKMAFFWPATSGNGTISSVCLCPNTMGNMGLKPFDTQYSPLSVFGNDSTSNDSWNETVAMQYPFSIDDNGKYAMTVSLTSDGTTDYFVEKKIRHDYFSFGIMRGTRDWQLADTRKATVRGGNNRFVVEDDTYYYIIRATSATTLQVDKVNKSTFAVTQADCTYSGVSLYTGTVATGTTGSGGTDKKGALGVFAFDGTYLYFPNASANGFYKLNLADNNDKAALDGTLTVHTGIATMNTYNGEQFHNPLVINDGLILGDNYIINGWKVYPIAQAKTIGCGGNNYSNRNWLWLVRKGAACYGNGKQMYSTGNWSGQSSVLNQMFLSSINNIESVVKSTSLAMEILYTLNEI